MIKFRNSAAEENVMIFSLDLIKDKENSELLTQAASLSIVTEPIFLGLGEAFSYEYCDQISKICGTLRLVPETQTLILDYNGFTELVSESSILLDTVAYNLGISKEEAMNQAQLFFENKNIVVQANGIHGALYTLGSYIQSAGSAGLVMRTVGMARLAGVSGLQVLRAQPLLAIAIPATGSIFLYGCAAIVGNNPVGKALTTTADILALPMKGIEIFWNSYANPVIIKVFGIPVIFNMTQSLKTGPGYTMQEISSYIPVSKRSVLKTVKERIIKWLS
jgi:hypothetical protein